MNIHKDLLPAIKLAQEYINGKDFVNGMLNMSWAEPNRVEVSAIGSWVRDRRRFKNVREHADTIYDLWEFSQALELQ